MAEMEFDKDHTNWLHGDDAPTDQDLDRIEEQEPEESEEQ